MAGSKVTRTYEDRFKYLSKRYAEIQFLGFENEGDPEKRDKEGLGEHRWLVNLGMQVKQIDDAVWTKRVWFYGSSLEAAVDKAMDAEGS